MTQDTATPRLASPGLFRGLSGKLLALTVIFVMLGEVLIFLPSIANFRIQWLKGRVAQAEIAVLAAAAAPGRIVADDLRTEILEGAGVIAVSLDRGEERPLTLKSDTGPAVTASYDLREIRWLSAISDAFAVMLRGGERAITVIDKPPGMSGGTIEVTLYESHLRAAMLRFGVNILILSLILSGIVAALVFAALHAVLLRPIKQLTRNMVSFRENPEDRSRLIAPSSRDDEIGMAERELHAMQSELSAMLQQKTRLAALGLAVSKVSHDLRNMLSSAQLISDRLTAAEDPTVKRIAPKLIASLDRAISFLSQTLRFGRAEEPPPAREVFKLKDLADEVIDAEILQASDRIVLFNQVPVGLEVDADREQMMRVLTNLLRNAIQALDARSPGDGSLPDGRVTLKARRDGSLAIIEIADNGPGIPAQVRPKLFEAFQSAAKTGGVGLGLAISAELVRAHGGEIRVTETGPSGTVFSIRLPDRALELRRGRRGAKRQALGG
jgi:signal transduction histidine kinase